MCAVKQIFWRKFTFFPLCVQPNIMWNTLRLTSKHGSWRWQFSRDLHSNDSMLLLLLFIVLIVVLSGYISPYFSPMNERMRKRRAFADQDLMDTTFTNYYLGYQQMQMIPPATPYTAINYNANNSKLVKVQQTEAPTRPKISFSIESIIGIKWVSSETSLPS